jgi:hypothetical protein
VLAGGRWNFFMDSFGWMRTQRGVNPWDVTGLEWVGVSPWVFLPAAAVVATLIGLWRTPRDRQSEWRTRAVGALAILWLIFASWDFVGSGALLYWPFYASWLAPWSFIALGAVVGTAPATLRAEALTLAVGAGALAASLAWPQAVRLSSPGFIPFAVTVAMIVAAVLVRSAVVSRTVLAGTLVCLHGWITTTSFYAPAADRADAFRAIDRAVGIMEQYIGDTQPRFLLTPPGRLGHYVQGLTSVYLWGYTIVTDRYPTVTAEQAARIPPGATVIVISETDDAASGFDEVFAPHGLSGVVRGSNSVETVHGPLYLTFLEATARPASDAAQAEGVRPPMPALP